MIRIKVSKKIFSYERVMFPLAEIKSDADVVRYMRYREGQCTNLERDFVSITPVTNLQQSLDDIWAQYDKKVRNEIRRAEKEGVVCSQYDTEFVKTNRLWVDEVIDLYYGFCDNINQEYLKKNLNRQEFDLLCGNRNIVISKAEYDNGWVYHIYMVDGSNALLWFSFSDYRKNDGNHQIAGWANRALHNFDISSFKEQGYRIYDWGNISSLSEPNGIDKFKMSFGGELNEVYYSTIGCTIKGKILLKIKKMINKG